MFDPLLAGGAVLFALIFAVIVTAVLIRRWRQRPSVVRPAFPGEQRGGESNSTFPNSNNPSSTVNLYSTKPIYHQYSPNLLVSQISLLFPFL